MSVSAGRARRWLSALTAAALALGGAVAVVATPLSPAPPAAAAPGNPGVPGDPTLLYAEDFENTPNGSNVLLPQYTSATGVTYSASAYWANRANCNGFVVDWTSTRNPSDCTGVANAAGVYNNMLAVPHALGQLRGVAPTTNGAAASYTAGSTTGSQIQFQTSQIPLPAANRFVTFSVDAGAMNCGSSSPLLRFYLLDAAGTEIPVSSSPINVCTDARGTTYTGVPTPSGANQTVRAGTFAANGSTLVTGSTLAVRMRNQNSSGGGNDGAYDNIEVLDVTPQLDKGFAPESTVVGGRSRLTFTVTNTSELAAKDGWEFTDNLPAGLEVARPPAVEADCDADVAAAGGGTTVAVTNGVLAAGQESCTISVAVTSRTAGSYTNGPDAFFPTTGMDLPGEATVTFTPFVGSGVCPTPAFLFQNAPSATPTEIDLVTGELVNQPPLTDVAYNGVGYSELADAFFGLDNPTDQIYLVSPDYTTVENLGSPDYSNVSFTFAQLFPGGVPIGDVSPDGVLYLGGGGSGTRSWMAVDVDQDSPTFLQVLAGGSVPAPAAPVNAGLDWVYNPDDGRLYSFGVNTNNGNAFVYAFDPQNPSAGFVQVAALGALRAPNGALATGGSSPFGATYGSPGFLYGANNQTGQIWRIPTDDPTAATFFAYGPGPTTNNDGARCASAAILTDLGDAPDTYGTTLSKDGARHGLVGYDAATNTAPLMLGDANTVDPDDDGVPTADASGDDATGVDDEAAVASPVVVSRTSGSTVTVTVTNQQDAATLAGWVDLDGNGTFDADELVTAAVPAASGTGTYDLAFPPATTTAGDTFARFRVFPGSVDAPSPTGAVSGGEVEDHPVTIAVEPFVAEPPPQCGAATRYTWIATSSFYNDNFGTASVRDLWVPGGGVVIDPDGADTTNNGVTGDANPYLSPVYVNDASGATTVDVGVLGNPVTTAQIPDASDMGDYGETVTDAAAANGLVPRSEVLLTVSRVSGTPGTPVALTISKTDTNTVLTAYVTDTDGNVLDTVPWRIASGAVTETLDGFAYPADGQLLVYTLDLDPAARGQATSVLGFACPTDLGDAPDSYGTTVAADGPQHEILALDPEAGTSPLMLGATIDAEADGVPTAGADGDDTAASDDEDGVADPISVSPVAATPVTVTATNDTDADATLAGWVDVDGDGAFQVVERSFVTVPAGSGTADYELLFPAATATSTTYARFRLFAGTVEAPQPTGAVQGGEVEDYVVEPATQELTIAKSADPAGEVLPGGTVEYTITVTNSGEVPYGIGDLARIEDSLTGVLDDAVVTTDPAATSDAGATPPPVIDAGTLYWEGPLAVGETVTITYAVTVNDPLTGDGTLTNAVVGPPESNCVDGTGAGCSADVPVRALTVAKAADPAGEVLLGGTVTYTVTVTNAGQVPYTLLDPATFTDDLTAVLDDATWDDDATADVGEVTFDDPVLSWSGALAVGATATVTYSVTVGDPLPEDGDGTLSNAVVGPPESGCDDGTEPGCSTDVPVRALQITKSADPADVVLPGGVVEYTVTVENTGQVAYPADGPATFTDDLTAVLDDATWNGDAAADVGATAYGEPLLTWSGALEPGASATITYSVTVDDPPSGDGTLTNAVVGPPESGCDDGTEPGCSTDVPVRALEITKSADPADVVPGGTVTYTVTVENTGAADFTADDPATFTDDLTAVLDDATWDDDATADVGTVTYDAPELAWSGALAAGETAVITYSVTVDDPLTGDGTLTNAVVGPPESNCDADADPADPACTTSTPVRALEITKSAAPAGEVLPGGTVAYTVTVTNTGEAPYTADVPATFTDDLTGVLDDATWDGGETADVGTVTWTDPELSWSGPLEPGQTATITYSVTVGDPLPAGGDGTLTNVVVGPPESGCDADADPVDPACTTSSPVRALEITKSADPAGEVLPGGTVTYTVTVSNTGQVPYTLLDPATFTDDLTAVLDDATWDDDAAADVGTVSFDDPVLSWSGALAVGETATVTYSVTVDDPPAGDGTLSNAVVGPPESGCDGGTEPGCTTDVPVRALEITKSAAPAGEVLPGGTVTYTVTVENTGQVAYTVDDPASVTDDLTAVLDDATWNADATADVGTVTYADPELAWSGPLEPGESAEITYSVTVNDPLTGDGTLANAVVGPPESGCDDGTEPGCSTDVPVRALEVAKSSDGTGAALPGDVVTYTVTVTNTGQVPFTADDPATFTDDLTAVLDDATFGGASTDTGATSYAEPVLSWSGPLEPGATAEITYTVTVNDPPSGDGVLENVVVGPPESNCTDPGSTDPACVEPNPVRALEITKTAAPAGEVLPGGTVTYTVTVENTGQAAYTVLAPASFTDDLSGVLDDATYAGDAAADVGAVSFADPVLSWSGPLQPGDVATVTYSVTVDDPLPADGDGTLANAVVGPPESGCDDGTEPGCTTDVPVRALDLTKTADVAEVTPGGTVTYTVTVTNTGQVPYTALSPATFTDDLTEVLDDATYGDDAVAGSGTTSYAEPVLSWSGALAPGEVVTVTYSVTVDDPLAADGDGTLANAVVGPPESGCDDGTEPGCSADVPVRALDVTKSADPAGEVLPGGTVTYTVTVTNTGRAPYTADAPATFTDDLTGVLDDASYDGDATADVGAVSYAEPVLTWSGALAPGEVAVVTYSVTVDDPPAGDGTLTNAVVGPPESGCDEGADPVDPACTTSTPVRALEITKAADPAGEVLPGGTVTYTVTVTNTGQVPYTADDPASFDDDLTAVLDDATYADDATADVGEVGYADPVLSWSGALAVGESATITYSVTVDDPLAADGDGTLTNAVVGPPESGCDDGTEPGCGVDVPVRALEITKSAAPVGEVLPGGTITYTVTVANTGQVAYTPLAPATFTDDLTAVLDDATYAGDAVADVGAVAYGEPVLSWGGALAVGESATITYSVTVNDPLTGDGTLTNAVLGPPESGCDDGTEPGCSTDVPVRALAITKSADPAGEVLPGGTVAYTVTVTNTGQVPYTAEDPASFDDDLTAVLDDASYDGDATADVGEVTYDDPVLSWSGELAPGESAEITYSVTVDDPVTGDGTLSNAVVGPPESGCDDGSEPGCGVDVPVRALEITKAADPAGEVLPGGTITYTVTVENTGQVPYTPLAPATFTDDLTAVLDDATYADDATADVGEVTYADPVLTWSGALAPGDVAVVTYAVTVNDPLTGDGTLTNAVVGPPEAGCDDGTEPGCSTDVPVRALEMTKSADPAGEVLPGGTVTYTVTVENTGQVPYTAEDPASFDDDLSAVLDDATYADDATADVGQVTYDDPVLSWSGALAPGESAEITYSVTVDDPVAGDGTLTNAVVGPEESGCEPGSQDPACSTDVPVRALRLTKTSDGAGEVVPGATVTYTITVENVGQVPYTDDAPASFTDDLSAVLDDATYAGDATADAGTTSYAEPTLTWTGPLPVGGTASVTYSVTVDDPPAGDGEMLNVVVGPPESNCTEATATDPDCVEPDPVRDLTISKSASPGGAVDAGSTVTYTVLVENTGGVAYTADAPASFTDDLSAVLDDATYDGDATADVGLVTYDDPVLSWSGELAPGESAEITYSVTVDNPVSGDGTLTNAVVGPDESGCEPGSADPACSTEVPVRALSLVKTSDGAEGAAAGDTVTYTVTVENTGQVPYTAEDPATFDDDLTEVLDDATFDGDATADVGTTSYAEPVLTWSGPLAPGETATVTYAVTVDDPGAGDGELFNVVLGPDESNCTDPGSDDPDCVEPDPLRDLEIVKTADPTGPVTAGDTVTYTVTATSTGSAGYPADRPASFTDVMTGVLDDATYDGDVTASSGEAAFDEDAEELSWSGPLPAGESVTVTYSVTVLDDAAGGDRQVANAVLGPQESNCPVELPTGGGGAALGVSTAVPEMPEGCQVLTPVRSFEVAKAADVDEAAPGDVVTYTVTVTSTGTAPYTDDVPAVVEDDLTDVLDDGTLSGTPTASAGEVSVDAPVLTWSGPLEVDGTVRVTYRVRVDDPDAGGGTLVNVVVAPEGSGGRCTDDGTCTTSTDVVPPVPPVTPVPGPGPGVLPRTGPEWIGALLVAALFLTVAGATLVRVRRGRTPD